MATNRREFRCTPEKVFEILADGWLFPLWVVGASRMRDVDGDWPSPQSRLHHSVGTWPLLLNDTTTVLEWSPPRRMVLLARGRPAGAARVEIDVSATEAGCVVTLTERPESGPAVLVPGIVAGPGLLLRNHETLRRLAFLCEGRETPTR